MGQEAGKRKPPRLPADLTDLDGPDLPDDVAATTVRGDFSNEAREQLVVERSRIVHAQFTAGTYCRMRLTDVVVENADFSGTDLDESSLNRVEFRDCRMSGVLLSRCELRDILFTGCRLDEANLRMCETKVVTFEGTDLRGSDFYGADLGGTRFFDCDLRGAEFSNAKAPGARFCGSNLTGLKGAQSLAGVVIDSASVYPVALGLLSELHIGIEDERR